MHVTKAVGNDAFEADQLQKQTEMAEGLSPEDAAKHMTVPPGFHVQLAASEPMVHQPIAMCFDRKGRLWIAEAHTYPLRAADGEGKDKILILEDTNGDGVFDTSKTFIEGLNLVSGLEVGVGGVYVGAAPYLMFIPDRDGDDKPDVPADSRILPDVEFPKDVPSGAVVLRDGFGWHDTHETLNAFIWGPDGWLYGCHGVFTHSKVGKPGAADEDRLPLNASVWRYHPTKDIFEAFMNGTSNPWGVDFNDKGQAFLTACVIPHLWHVIQGARYHRQGGQHFNPYTYDDIKTIADHQHYAGNLADSAWWGHEPRAAGATLDAGGGHAHAGAMIYLGDNWPDEYRNRIYFNNVHGNRVNCDILEREDGSGYVGHHGKDLLLANDHYFRGINLRYGPDGSVYLIDWYDKNACHRTNPEIWDRSNGRIYRISYGDVTTPVLFGDTLTTPQILHAHHHKNEWYSRTVRKELTGQGTTEKLSQELQTLIFDAAQPVHIRLRCLWTLHAANGATNGPTILKLLADHEEYIRAWAIQLELEDKTASGAILNRLEELAATDPSPVVRLYLTSALQRLPNEARWGIATALAAHGEDAEDHNIPLMLWYGTEPLVPDNPKRAIELALQSKIPLLRSYILRRASSTNETLPSVVAVLGQANNAELQGEILNQMMAAFEGRVEIPMPESWKSAYVVLTKSEQQDVRDKADQVAVLFGDQRVFKSMRGLLADPSQKTVRRQQALGALVKGQDKASADVLLSDSVLSNAELQSSAIKALSTLGNDRTPAVLLARYKSLSNDVRVDVISTLISRPTWTRQLLEKIGNRDIPSSDLHAYHVRQILSFQNTELNDLLKAHWGEIRESSADRRELIANRKQELTPRILAKANTGNGRRIFVKTCQNCHRLFGTGGEIGPDITGSNRVNLDYILENILDPSAVVGRDYQMTVVALKDGRSVSGLLKLETDSALTIQTINDKVVVPKSEIEERVLSSVSMMPERQLDPMTKDEVRDLIAYLGSPHQVVLAGPASPIDLKSGKVPGAIEGESMKIIEKSGGNAVSQNMGGFTADRWSGNDHLWWTGGKPGDKLALEIPVDVDGNYDVEIVLTRASDYGIIKLSIDDAVLDPSLDLFTSPRFSLPAC